MRLIKKIVFAMAMVFMIAASIASHATKVVAASEYVYTKELVYKVGVEGKVSLSMTSEGETKKVTLKNWKSSNSKVVKVTKKGSFVCKEKGKAAITAEICSGQDNAGKKVKWIITVKSKKAYPVLVNPEGYEIQQHLGEKKTLYATVYDLVDEDGFHRTLISGYEKTKSFKKHINKWEWSSGGQVAEQVYEDYINAYINAGYKRVSSVSELKSTPNTYIEAEPTTTIQKLGKTGKLIVFSQDIWFNVDGEIYCLGIDSVTECTKKFDYIIFLNSTIYGWDMPVLEDNEEYYLSGDTVSDIWDEVVGNMEWSDK